MSTVSPTSFGSFPVAAVPPASFTLDEYEHMVACGAFSGEYEKNVELLWGRITEMPPIGPAHSNNVDVINSWSVRATLGEAIRVRTQNPIRIPPSNSAPQPDICWVRERDYSKRHPGPDDVLLVIEIADSTIERDRVSKLAAYAQAGIREYWIVNLVDQQVEIYREPKGLDYSHQQVLKEDNVISPLALPAAEATARQLLANPGN